jgi:hypothetical protein
METGLDGFGIVELHGESIGLRAVSSERLERDLDRALANLDAVERKYMADNRRELRRAKIRNYFSEAMKIYDSRYRIVAG